MHFTYEKPRPDADLQQGDIVRRTAELEEIIGEIHPYYLKPDYTHFMVLTQSCDLVTRAGAAPYIAISPIRSLSTVLQRELNKFQQNDVLRTANALSDKHRDHARRFVQRLLNNNEQEYFYLHEEVPDGISDASCVFLRLSISLRQSHYSTIRQARILGLSHMFQAKLGWLLGNIYARVGTDDWLPNHISQSEWKGMVDRIIDENIVFLNEKKVQQVLKGNDAATINAWSREEAISAVDSTPQMRMRDEVVEIVVSALQGANIIDDGVIAKARNLLRSSPDLKTKIPN